MSHKWPPYRRYDKEEFPLCPDRLKEIVFDNKLLRNTKNKYYDIKNGIMNLVKYFKLIWKDRDWDYVFLLNILEFKLKGIRNDQNNGFTEGYEEIVKKLDRAIELCNNLKYDNYSLKGQCERKDELDELLEIIKSDLFKWWT